MEALLEKEGTVESWNDERMDELSRRVDDGFKEMREGFTRVDREMKEGFSRVDREMKEGFARVEDRFDRLNHTLFIGVLGVVAAVIANGAFG
jgi:hypothetical protein